jgi:antitoxin (DNA-binding transcriptional repressor) of toxin-antitoxin stability system
MSHTVPIEQAATQLAELVGMLRPGDEIVLTKQDRPVARIVPSKTASSRRQAGNCKGMLIIRQEDREHLEDFQEYMP